MNTQAQLTRREMIRGSVAVAALAFVQYPLSTFGFADPEEGATLIPFLDVQPPGKMLQWEQLTSWITPNDQVFSVSITACRRWTPPTGSWKSADWSDEPMTLSLADIKARKRKTVTATLECSGNSNSPGFMGAIGNVKWTGTPLAPLLKECEPLKRGIEVVFFGADDKVEEEFATEGIPAELLPAACTSPTRCATTSCSATR